jgi:hypothetical protein
MQTTTKTKGRQPDWWLARAPCRSKTEVRTGQNVLHLSLVLPCLREGGLVTGTGGAPRDGAGLLGAAVPRRPTTPSGAGGPGARAGARRAPAPLLTGALRPGPAETHR